MHSLYTSNCNSKFALSAENGRWYTVTSGHQCISMHTWNYSLLTLFSKIQWLLKEHNWKKKDKTEVWWFPNCTFYNCHHSNGLKSKNWNYEIVRVWMNALPVKVLWELWVVSSGLGFSFFKSSLFSLSFCLTFLLFTKHFFFYLKCLVNENSSLKMFLARRKTLSKFAEAAKNITKLFLKLKDLEPNFTWPAE